MTVKKGPPGRTTGGTEVLASVSVLKDLMEPLKRGVTPERLAETINGIALLIGEPARVGSSDIRHLGGPENEIVVTPEGVRIEKLNTPGSPFSVSVDQIPAGVEVNRHYHAEVIEVQGILSQLQDAGQAKLYVNGNVYDAEVGTVAIIPQMNVHAARNSSSVTLDRFSVYMPKKNPDDYHEVENPTDWK